MQDYGGGVSSKTGEYRESGAERGRERNMHQEGYQPSQHQYAVMQSKNYGKILNPYFSNTPNKQMVIKKYVFPYILKTIYNSSVITNLGF